MLSQVVKNLDKHSHMIETQCSQIYETQYLILSQLDKDNLVSTNEILTHTGKRPHEPKGSEWQEKEQEQRIRESQSQTQENRELLFGEVELEEQVHQDAHNNQAEAGKEVDSNAEIVDGDNNKEEVTLEVERVEEPRVDRNTRPPYPTSG